MATIVVINGRHRGEWYTIPESPKGLIIGRGDNLLAEVIDPRVSHQHLRVFRDPKTARFSLEDLESRNGTRVNGKSVQFHDLNEEDLIQIGHTLLGFTTAEFAADEQVEGFVERMRSKAGPTLAHIEDREEYTEAAALFSRIIAKLPGRNRKKK